MRSYSFGSIEIQPHERRLIVDGREVALGARALDVLIALAERAGSLVSKNDLLERVWPGVVVEENNLQVQVSTLRKLLGPGAIATIPGRGYRFTLSETDGVERQNRSDSTPISHPAADDASMPACVGPLANRDERMRFGGRTEPWSAMWICPERLTPYMRLGPRCRLSLAKATASFSQQHGLNRPGRGRRQRRIVASPTT